MIWSQVTLFCVGRHPDFGVLARAICSTFLSLIVQCEHIFWRIRTALISPPLASPPGRRLAMLMVGGSVIALALLLPRNIYWLTHFAGPLFASSGVWWRL